jgi:hypothetical protein
MDVRQLKILTNTKTKHEAINCIFSRLNKRTWKSGNKVFCVAGIDYKSLHVHLLSITSDGINSANVDRRVFPMEHLIDCVSGNFDNSIAVEG